MTSWGKESTDQDGIWGGLQGCSEITCLDLLFRVLKSIKYDDVVCI